MIKYNKNNCPFLLSYIGLHHHIFSECEFGAVNVPIFGNSSGGMSGLFFLMGPAKVTLFSKDLQLSLIKLRVESSASGYHVFYSKAGTNHQVVFHGTLPCCKGNRFWRHINMAA